ncbi:hypothetical protein [Ruminococcus sp.]|uniref:hypothetical protein n=1 Tax=Ruminococcus sp. TaxID=41978 RepID=UPI0025F1B1F9|nr:hypothetical protein [Ruminococcus sp.]
MKNGRQPLRSNNQKAPSVLCVDGANFIRIFLVAVANLKASAVMFQPPKGKPFGY